MSDDPALPKIELGGIVVWDARKWFPYKGNGGAVVFRPRTMDQIEETAIHHDAVAFSGRDLDFNGSTVDEERDRMQASYNWHTKQWPNALVGGGAQGWNWPGMGYHLYTFPSGRIYLVGEIDTIRAHVAYRNLPSTGIVGAGDFTRRKPQGLHIVAYAMAAAWSWLVRGAELPLSGHRVWAEMNPPEVRSAWGTSCPGDTHGNWIPDVRRIANIEYERATKEVDDMTNWRLYRDTTEKKDNEGRVRSAPHGTGALFLVERVVEFPYSKRVIKHPEGQRYLGTIDDLNPPIRVGSRGEYTTGEFDTIPIIGD